MSIYFSHCSAHFTYGNMMNFKERILRYYDVDASFFTSDTEKYPVHALLMASDYDGKYEISCHEMMIMLPDLRMIMDGWEESDDPHDADTCNKYMGLELIRGMERAISENEPMKVM